MSNAFDCPACEFDAYPGFVLANSGKLIVECPKCQYLDPTRGPADFSTGLAVPAATEGVGWAGKSAVEVSTKAEPPPPIASGTTTGHLPAVTTSVGYVPLSAPTATAPEPLDILAHVQQRSLWLATEHARLSGELAGTKSRIASVAAEQKALARMLRVAQPKDEG